MRWYATGMKTARETCRGATEAEKESRHGTGGLHRAKFPIAGDAPCPTSRDAGIVSQTTSKGQRQKIDYAKKQLSEADLKSHFGWMSKMLLAGLWALTQTVHL